MKVVFFDFIINYGGAPQGSAYLMKRLKDNQVNVKVIDGFGASTDYLNYLEQKEIPYEILDKREDNLVIGGKNKIYRFSNLIKQIPMYMKVIYRLYGILKNEKTDFIIVNNEKSLFFLSLLKSKFNFKVILYFRGEGTQNQLRPRFLNLISNYVDYTLTHSREAFENLKYTGISLNSLSYLPNCIELEKFDIALKNQDFPLKNNNFKVILAAARPVKEKGHHTAIDALHLLHTKGYQIDLIIPGVIPVGSNNTFYEYLIQKIVKYDLINYVHFIGWRKNLIGDIVGCDAVILPSHTEGFPRVIIEAMAQGVPVCATPVGGIPEAILHNETGMLSEVDNAEQLANNLEKIILDQSFYNELSKSSKEYAYKNFHPDLNTKVVLETLSSLCEKKC